MIYTFFAFQMWEEQILEDTIAKLIDMAGMLKVNLQWIDKMTPPSKVECNIAEVIHVWIKTSISTLCQTKLGNLPTKYSNLMKVSTFNSEISLQKEIQSKRKLWTTWLIYCDNFNRFPMSPMQLFMLFSPHFLYCNRDLF